MTENQRVKELRNYLKLNQEEFSNSIALKQGSLSDLERGKIGISSEVLKTLIKVYRINPIWLYEGEGEMFLKLDNFYINEEKNFKLENTEKYDKSNKTENGDDNKNDNRHDNNGYILEENQGSDRVEEEAVQSHKIIKQPISQVINQGLSPPEAEILNERIQSLKEILKSKEEVLKAKDKHIELLEDKIKTLQNQVNNPLRVGENNIRDAA